jgi:hypothetical protein
MNSDHVFCLCLGFAGGMLVYALAFALLRLTLGVTVCM